MDKINVICNVDLVHIYKIFQLEFSHNNRVSVYKK